MATTAARFRALASKIFFAICVVFAFSLSQSRAADNAYEINVIMPMTGGASFVGKSGQQALQLAEKVINKNGGIHGRPVRFVIYDDQTSPQVAVQLANQIIAKRVPVLLGSSIVAMCNAMAPLMQNGPVMFCFSPGLHPAPGSYVFSSNVSTHDTTAVMVRYFRLRGWKRIAILVSTDSTGQDAERGLNDAFALPENKDVKVVSRAHFNPTDVSVSAQIEQIKAAQPQVLIAWTTGTQMGTVLRSVAQAGLDIPVGTTSGNLSYSFMTQFAAVLPRELYFAGGSGAPRSEKLRLNPAMEKAKKDFHDAYATLGIAPENGSEVNWDPVMIVAATLNHLGDNPAATQIRDSIAHLKGFAGVSGIYNFEKVPQRGIDGHFGVVSRWNAERKMFEAVSQLGGEPITP